MVGLCTAAGAGLAGFLGTPLGVPFLDTLYVWIQTMGGVPEGEREAHLTYGSLIFLILAFFTTVTYKLINGPDNPPFKDGTFPQLPPPPWHRDFDADAPVTLSNKDALILQIFSYSMAIPGSLLTVYGDLMGISQAEGVEFGDLFLQGFLALAVGVCDVFGWMVTNYPDVTGSDWDNPGWAGAFACGTAITVTELAAATAFLLMPEDQRKNTSAYLQLAKVNGVLLGPVLSGALGGAALIFESYGLISTATNQYTQAQFIMGMIPEFIQVFRLIAVKLPKPYGGGLALAILIADALLNGASALMGLTASSFEDVNKPSIASVALSDAPAGIDYTKGTLTALTASGADKPWNSPIANWGVVTGTNLPQGLSLQQDASNPARCVITGAAQVNVVGTGQTFEFQIQCSDSYGPPQYSPPQAFTLKVTPCPVKNIAPPAGKPASVIAYVSTTNNPSGPADKSITVTATDASGNPVAGAQIMFSFTAGTAATATFVPADGSGPLNGLSYAYAYTDKAGVATAPLFTTNGVTGQYSMQAGIQGPTTTDKSGNPVITYLAGPVDAADITNTPTNVTSLVAGDTCTAQSISPFSGHYYAFPNQLIAIAKAGNEPVANLVLCFAAPPDDPENGPYGYFQGSNSRTVVTDAGGLANAGLFSGVTVRTSGQHHFTFPLNFTITAQLNGISTPEATFSMTYLAT